jgi:ribA/ribD-fused uncharacterized protein
MKLNSNPEELIDWFDDFEGPNPYSFLSNFYDPRSQGDWKTVQRYVISVPQLGGDADSLMVAWTTEHLFAAAKSDDIQTQNRILQARTPAIAKYLGRECELRPDWEAIKVGVMTECLAEKFRPNNHEGYRLLATGTADLVEGTYWNDRIWGVDLTDPERPGMNLLGALLMARRAQLRHLTK